MRRGEKLESKAQAMTTGEHCLFVFFRSPRLFSPSSSSSTTFTLQENIKQAEASLKLIAADPGYAIALLKVRKKKERRQHIHPLFHSIVRFRRSRLDLLSNHSLSLSSSSPPTHPSSSARPRPSPSRTTSSSNGSPQQQQPRTMTQRTPPRRRPTATELLRPQQLLPSRRRSSTRSRPRSSR